YREDLDHCRSSGNLGRQRDRSVKLLRTKETLRFSGSLLKGLLCSRTGDFGSISDPRSHKDLDHSSCHKLLLGQPLRLSAHSFPPEFVIEAVTQVRCTIDRLQRVDGSTTMGPTRD